MKLFLFFFSTLISGAQEFVSFADFEHSTTDEHRSQIVFGLKDSRDFLSKVTQSALIKFHEKQVTEETSYSFSDHSIRDVRILDKNQMKLILSKSQSFKSFGLLRKAPKKVKINYQCIEYSSSKTFLRLYYCLSSGSAYTEKSNGSTTSVFWLSDDFLKLLRSFEK